MDQGVLGERTDTYNSVLKDACDRRVSIQLDMLYLFSAHYDFQMHFMHHKCKHLVSSDVIVLVEHVNVQSCLLILYQYQPMSLQYSWLSVEQPIRFRLSVVYATLGISNTMEDDPLLQVIIVIILSLIWAQCFYYKTGHVKLAKKCISAGCNTLKRLTSLNGTSALHCAARADKNSAQITKLLLESGTSMSVNRWQRIMWLTKDTIICCWQQQAINNILIS